MARFDRKSRYARHAETYQAVDRRGRRVTALTPAEPPRQRVLGEHLLRQGQRLDHLAGYYFKDPNGFWRLCELNEAILPDSLAEVEAVEIPTEV